MRVFVNYTSASRSLSTLKQSANELSALIADVQSVYRRISRCTGIGADAADNIKRAMVGMTENTTTIIQLCDVGTSALEKYCLCENTLAGNGVSVADSATIQSVLATGDIEWGALIGAVGQLGMIGGIAGALFSVADDPKNIGKSIPKLVESGAKMAAKIADKQLIDVWGTSTVDAIGFSENFKKQLDGYIINNAYNSKNMSVAAKNASNISAVAKWCGVAVSGMLNFVDNFDEYNADFSNPRLYAETIGETAVDVGLGMIVGAGVAALAGATAPVWAVGVVSTGVILGANWVSGEVFEKDVAELISDVVLDTAEAVGELVCEMTKEVGSAIRTTAKTISVGWKKLKSWF